jgi:hypothetical protein
MDTAKINCCCCRGWLLTHAGAYSQVIYHQLSPGEQAVISFHFNGSPSIGGRQPDLLVLLIGGNTPLSLSSTTYSLFDGDTLLGSIERGDANSYNGQAFRSFDNPATGYLVGPSVPVDFSSIRSGTIAGRLIYTPSFTGPAQGDHATIEFELYLLQQSSYSGGWVQQNPTIDSVRIVQVPEPGAAGLLALALCAALVRRRGGFPWCKYPGKG